MDDLIKLNLELPECEAMALAQFVKRLGWSEMRAFAVDENEADEIREGIYKFQCALAQSGFNPR